MHLSFKLMFLKVQWWKTISVSLLSSVCFYALVRIFSTDQCCHTDAWGNQIRTFVRNEVARGSHPVISLRCLLSVLSPRESTWLFPHFRGRHHCRAFSKETLAPQHIESIFPLFFCYRGCNIRRPVPFSSRSKHSDPYDYHLTERVPSRAEVILRWQQAEQTRWRTRSWEGRESVKRISGNGQGLVQTLPPHFWHHHRFVWTNSSADAQ